VQRQFWEALPPWHHWIFFLLILVMMPLGGVATRHVRAKLGGASSPAGLN